MKNLLLIAFVIFLHPAIAQDDFLSVYHKLDEVRQRQKVMQDQVKKNVRDTAQFKASIKQHNKFLSDSILPIAKQVLNLTFPDINFTDTTDKAYSISDFRDKEVIVNYNYLYCQHCLDRIDSTLKYIKGRKVQLIVLFLDKYSRQTGDLKEYGDNVIIGFINEDNRDLISLSLGDNSMYYLDKNRRIEFFDRIAMSDHEIAWTTFLKNY